jgi:hypothetical protein
MKLKRLRKFILITGTTLCVMIAAAFVVSGWWLIGTNTQGDFVVLAQSGRLVIGFDDTPEPPSLMLQRHNDGLNFWLRCHKWEAFLFIPLAYVLMAIAIPTLLVWRFGRKPIKPGHCRCGYDLTGNESGRCSECGWAVGSR